MKLNIIKTVLLFITIVSSYSFNYNLKIIKNYKKISYNDVNKNKNNIKELILAPDNKKIYIKLNNNTEYNYYNNKCTDILGVLPILSLLTK